MKTKLFTTITVAFIIIIAKSSAQSNKSLSNLTAPTAINQSLLPNPNNTLDLGNVKSGWRDIYISNRIFLKGSVAMFTSGTGNFFAGTGAGNNSITGTYNGGFGPYTLSSVTSGYSNTATGAFALNSNETGFNNTATGVSSLANNTGGAFNTATGSSSMHDNETGSQNTATGYSSLFSNQTGSGNTATGSFAMNTNTTGYSNTANGNLALFSNSTGFYNTATGSAALNRNTTGAYNTAAGTEAMRFNTIGGKNAALGWQSLYNNTSGEKNTAIGISTLRTNSSGIENTALGAGADVKWSFLQNATAIGANAVVDASNKVRIGSALVTSIGGQVGWTTFSDGRYKRDIKEDVAGLAFINSLRPVSYTVDTKSLNAHLRKGMNNAGEDELNANEKSADESSKILHDGFVAQEVEQAAQKLGFEFGGIDKPKTEEGLYGLRYDNFVVPLVKAVQELSKQNDSLQKQMNELKTLLLKNNYGDASSPGTVINTKLTDASLEQNAPNPFTSTTSIRYSLPQKISTAKIIITDINGKAIKQFNVSGSGSGVVNIDASTLSAGTYQYIMIINGINISSKQMILTK